MEHVSQIIPRVRAAIAHPPLLTAAAASVRWAALICLASSRKSGGYCVAGRTWSDAGLGPWVRPVSGHGQGELSFDALHLESGETARVGDVLQVPFGADVPDGVQRENRAVSDKLAWKQVGVADWDLLSALAESPALLWANDGHPKNDRLAAMDALRFNYSLCLIRVPFLHVRFFKDGYGHVKTRAVFEHEGVSYDLSVTDPAAEALASSRLNQMRVIEDALLCISLTQPFKGFCYKLVASVITRRRMERRFS